MSFRSYGEILLRHSQTRGERGFTFLVDGEQQEVFHSYRELDRQARSIAQVLRDRRLSNEQVILLFPPGLEFIAALFGCFYEGTVAVPLAPPNPKRLADELKRMALLARDSRARAVLTTAWFHSIFAGLSDVDPAIAGLEFVVLEEAIAQPASGWQPPDIRSERLAFLQYTSGSTGVPKGVMVTHQNLIENSRFLQRACNLDETSHGVSWLPMFHDFGLIGFVLQPVFLGVCCTILSPLSFLQRPVRWLQAISRYRAGASGAPNFAFELCLRRITDRECEGLDLSSWRVAQCAAEPVRKNTLERFTERFSRYGFRGTTFSPCYGLAESTLLTTASPAGRGMVSVDFSARALEEGQARPAQASEDAVRTLVALGHTHQAGHIAIVGAESRRRLPDGEVGEIWLVGPSVTAGYFGNAEQTERVFHATLADEPGTQYLRTGDLGFLHGGELFMTGRLKDLLIIRGRNHYPQDIEQTVESVSPQLRGGCSAAFSVEVDDEEVAVVVADLAAGTSQDEAAQIGVAVRQAVSEQHGLSLHAICLATPGTVPKTSSGKLQRSRCRAYFLGGTLHALWQWSALAPAQPAEPPSESPSRGEPAKDSAVLAAPNAAPSSKAQPTSDSREAALAWLHTRLEDLAHAAGVPLYPEAPLTALGLDSMKLVALSGELAQKLGHALPPTFFFDHPTLAAMEHALRGGSLPSASGPDLPAPSEPIAIVGMACRLPGAIPSPAAYWQLLAAGRDAITPFPAERWDVEAIYDPDPNAVGKTYCKHGGFLSGLDQFDAAFFGIAPREAVSIEPQQRLVLETAWEAIENAQIAPSRLAQTQTGVYMGSQGSDYHPPAADPSTLRMLDGYVGTGHASSVLSGRVAYALNLQGPAITVDTACSSSLVALHLACEGLRRGDCDWALAGGVQVMNTPAAFVEFSRLRGLAPDGRCKSFAASADGTSWSEGCGILVLKRLADAQRDGDRVWALIRGTAINQDGRSQGLTAPNGPAQERVIRRALARSGLSPHDIDAIEAHGTGTQLGDPIEAGALAAVFAADRDANRPLYVGSSKSNVGHTQAAAGVASVMKLALSLQHECLPKTLHAETASPHIDWQRSRLQLLQEATPWPRCDRVRRAGVSSFGISGTNAHAVIEEAPYVPPVPSVPERAAELVVLSGQSEAAVRSQVARLHEHVQSHPEQSLVDVAFSLATTRSVQDHRLAITATSREGLLEQLSATERGLVIPGVKSGRAIPGSKPKLVFVFPGQGSQWLGMGRSLLASEPVFRAALTACDAAIQAEAGFSVLSELAADEATSCLGRIEIVQPVLFAMSVALATLWSSWGVEPSAVVGHSMGEIAAAHVGGALTLRDAAAIVCRRSRLLQRISGKGEMALVELSVAETEQAIAAYPDRLSVAVSNSPRSTVIAGDPQAIAAVLNQLAARGVYCRRVKVDVASHSPQVDPLRDDLLACLAHIAPRKLSIPMTSTVSGEPLQGDELSAGYWVNNLRQTVRFAAVVQALFDSGHRLFIEVSPHPILVPAIEELQQAAKPPGVALGSLRRGQCERAELLTSLGGLLLQGYPVAWARLFPQGGRRIDLPTYAWQRARYVRQTDGGQSEAGRARVHQAGHPLIGEAQRLSTQPGTLLWDTSLLAKSPAWIDDHKLRGTVVFPGAGHIEMALVTGVEALATSAFAVCDLVLIDALVLPADAPVALQIETNTEPTGHVRFQVSSRQVVQGKTVFRTHSRAVLTRIDTKRDPTPLDVAALRSRMTATTSSATFYATLSSLGLELGPSFQGLRELWQGSGEVLSRVLLPESCGSVVGYHFHPALLDACLQGMAACFRDERDNTPWVPVQITQFILRKPPQGELYCHVKIDPHTASEPTRRRADLWVADAAGNIVAEIAGLVVQRLDGARRSPHEDWFLAASWEAVSLASHAHALSTGRWLLLGQAPTLAESLRAALIQAGHAVVQVPSLSAAADSVRDLLRTAFQGREPTAVLCLYDRDAEAPPHEDNPLPAILRHSQLVLSALQAIAAMSYRDAPRLWLLTRGAQSVSGESPAVALAPLLGLGRSIALEHPELRCSRLDLDPTRPFDEAAAVVAELVADDAEEELALRDGQRWVSRLIRRALKTAPRERLEAAAGRPFRLERGPEQGIERLTLRACARRAPGPHEIEIAVQAADVNPHDLRMAQEPLDTKTGPGEEAGWLALGSACTGRVVAVGEGVQSLAPGDSVVALAPGAFASHITCSAAAALPLPQGLSSAQAAALPAAFLSAYYALHHLAHLAPGERVLVHASSGALGLAAIQWAQHVSASVFATAGTPEERAFLHSLGVSGVSDVRSDQLVSDIRSWTQGHGVDVVLSSLSDDLIQESPRLLADHGRFIALGMRSAQHNQALDLAVFRRNVSFALFDFAGLVRTKPALIRTLWQDVLAFFESSVFSPPPVFTLPIDRARDAFRTLALGQTSGAIVLCTDVPSLQIAALQTPHATFRSDSSYLISGGLGGLGLSLAAWLAQRGAGQLVLLSRSTPSPQQDAVLAGLRAHGTQVLVVPADVAERDALVSVLRQIDDLGRPLRGVFHAAGVLDDGVLLQQTRERFERVLRPKVQGAWLLSELTQSLPLDHFVLYSSAAGLLGSPGQANYAAANTFLDALAHARRAAGLPALSIDWGAFADVGLAAQRENRAQRLELRGMRSIKPDEGLQILGELLASDEAQLGVVPLNLRQWGAFHQVASASTRFSALRGAGSSDAASEGDRELLARLRAALPSKRPALIAEHLRAQVAHVLRIAESQVELDTPLTSLGLDSLMGLELRNRVEALFGIKVPATLLWTYPTLIALSAELARSLSGPDEPEAEPPEKAPPDAAPHDKVLHAGEEELFALLDESLARVESKVRR